MSFHTLSVPELKLFLEDLLKSINELDNTDFRKILFYLFGFTSARLEEIVNNKELSNNLENFQLLSKLVTLIELVLTKEKHLLNSSVQDAESKIAIQPTSLQLAASTGCLLYEWVIEYALAFLSYKNIAHLSNPSNILKSLIISIINLITTKLHKFQYKSKLKKFLFASFDESLQYLFVQNIGLAQGFQSATYKRKLASLVHLFTIINDYDISNRLSGNTVDFELKLESYARKLWFILNSVNLITLPDFQLDLSLVDRLKLLIILNLSNNLILNEVGLKFSTILYVTQWIMEHVLSLDDSTVKANWPNEKLTSMNKCSVHCLLKIFELQIRNGAVISWTNLLQLKMVLPGFASWILIKYEGKTGGYRKIDGDLVDLHRVLYIIDQATTTDPSAKSVSSTRQLFPYLFKPFEDPSLEASRVRIIQHYQHLNQILGDPVVSREHPLLNIASTSLFQSVDDKSPPDSNWLHYIIRLLTNEKPPTLDVGGLITVINAIGNFPCLIQKGEYVDLIDECYVCGSSAMYKTAYEVISPTRKNISESQLMTTLYKKIIIENLLTSEKYGEAILLTPLVSTSLLIALFKIFSHFRPPQDSRDDIFSFICKCLSVDNRDVRLLAGRILPLYLIAAKDSFLEANFRQIFGTVSSIRFGDDKTKIHLAESTIYTLGELAIVTDNGEYLCALFVKLIDLFGESNEQHVNLIYNVFLNISAAKQVTPYKLLSPFLPSIAERIVKQPRMFSKLTELLGISKKYFLIRTKDYTTPRLLEYYKYDFIQEIADSSGVTKLQLITKNLPRIIATYLCKGNSNVVNEDYIINVLGNAAPEFRGAKMLDLVVGIGAITWYILLQIREDEQGKFENEKQIIKALNYVGQVSIIKSGGDPTSVVGSDFVKGLLGDNILELVQRFSENVHQIKGSKPYLEKVSSLRAIEFLIERNIVATSTALGQISTCLQATLENSDFQLQAITCWNLLVQKLETPHLISLFDIIILIIFQKFQQFEPKSKMIAVEILKKLFLELRDKYNKYALYYFSVPFVEGLDKYYQLDSTFITLLRSKSKTNHFPEFTRRLKTGNRYVVQQALVDLINFTTKNQKLCQMEDFKDKDLAGAATKKSILELLRTLLDTAQLFKNKGLSEISTKCAFAMSVIGALDPNKFSLKSIKEQVIVIHDFTDYKEYAEFLRYFMENIVIKSFWASNSPVKQLYSAYSMQKFLGVLKLDERVLTATQDPYAIRAGNGGQVDTLSQEYFVDIWNKFSDIGKSTLTPLLSSKYVPPPIKYEPLNFPYFKLSMSYEKWLVDLTSNLLNRALRILENGQIDTNSDSNSPKAVIFRTCSILVRDQDISVCTYLFKYVSLSLIINGDNTSFNNLKTEFLSILQHDSSKLPPDRSELLINCFQSVFEVLDYFNEWYSVATQYLNDNVKASTPLKKSLGLVQKFLEHLPMSLIAKKSAECDSYERTILYLEKCYREDIVSDDEVVPTLQRMYSNINDYDSLSGILKKFSTNNLQEKLSTFQYNENWSLAQESFQVLSLIGDKQDKVANNAKLLKSLSDHAFYEEVLSNLGSKVNFQRDNLNEIPLVWSMTGLSASVSSGNFDELEKWMYITESISTKLQDKETMIQYQVAKSLKFLKEGDKLGFERCIDNVYETIGTSLVSSMSSSSISKNSLLINQLHALYDLTSIATRGGGSPDDFILRERLTNIDQSFETQWKILSIHYATNVAMGKNENVLGEILLRSSETARKNERLDVATRCIMKAMVLNEKEANIQYTELLWAQGRQTEAIKNLHSIIKDGEFKNTQQRAKAQLQYAVWLDESNHSSSTTIIDEYSKAYKLESIWDKPYYDLGKYYSKIMESKQLNETFSNNSGSNSSGPDMSGYYEQQTIRYFLKALALGPTFIFEALPKLITIWLDFAQLSQTSEDAQRRLQQIVQDIKTSIDTIPIYVWYTAITQLLLRIGHSHEPSSHLLMAIVSNLIQAYPKYSLWYVLSHLNSNDKLRRKRVSMTLSDSQKKKRELVEIIMGAQSLFLSLIKIASHDIKKSTVVRKMLLSRDFQTSFNLTEPCTALVIPVRSNLEIRLPLGKYNPKTFTAFPKAAAVTFNGFDDVISIFQSLQKPKQVTIRGSDYNVFRLLLKRDDTRKDAKVVEFTTMINRLLLSNNETRKRNLFITNYSVVSLAENLGVIEFVQDVATMKSVINDQRQRMGGGGSLLDKKLFLKLDGAQRKLKQHLQANGNSSRGNSSGGSNSGSASNSANLAGLMKFFQELCTDVAPPVLHNWFLHQFSDPGAWYLARTTFTRSSAVMSMVGYIIGLGDRHCENILFLKKTGGVLHIDFDCLFDKGQTLPVPEIVPFRLTQNLVDAMGITGIEGSFRITCEATATLLRENEALLMNILETLLYDPLLDWKSEKSNHHHSQQQTPEGHLRRVRRKIRGLVDEKEGLPMNVHGQVDVLIQEACSPEILCQMYGGWAPYI